jgi:hypothetical protein
MPESECHGTLLTSWIGTVCHSRAAGADLSNEAFRIVGRMSRVFLVRHAMPELDASTGPAEWRMSAEGRTAARE